MAFFLIERDRANGSLKLLASHSFPTREEALAALPGLVGGDGGEVFVSDLDAATPVLFVPQTPSPADITAEVEEDESPSVEEVAETQVEPVAEAESADVIEESDVGVWEAPVEERVSEDATVAPSEGLADALRRAATSLESEGIVTPESIPSMTEIVDSLADDLETEEPGEPEGPEESAEEAVAEEPEDETDEIANVIASLGVSEPMSEIEPIVEEESSAADVEADEAEASGGDWPWANVEQVSVDEGAAGEAEVEVGEAPSTDDEVEQAAEDDGLIVANAETVDFTPRPVIMGDYGDVPEPVTEEEVPVTEEDAAEAVAEDVSPEPAVEATAGVESAPAYEPGEISLGDYTCDDCVYANTCPKAGSSSPEECGSFQWKSV